MFTYTELHSQENVYFKFYVRLSSQMQQMIIFRFFNVIANYAIAKSMLFQSITCHNCNYCAIVRLLINFQYSDV